MSLANLVGKKWTLALLAIVAIVVMALAKIDLETLKYAAGSIAGLVGLTNIGQGLADGLSKGKTSSRL